MRPNTLTKIAISALEDIKARDILVLDVRKMTALYDTLIIATAESARQTKALSAHLREDLRAAGGSVIGSEGEESGEWVLVDCGEFVVHIMQPAVRAHYNLEELWTPPEPARAPRAKAKLETASPAKKPLKRVASKAATRKPAQTKATAKAPAAKPAVKKVSAKKTAAKKATPKPATKTTAKAPAPAPAAGSTRRRLKDNA
jgi:ribosome-associated protein